MENILNCAKIPREFPGKFREYYRMNKTNSKYTANELQYL
jgi:hypothetical protein